MRVMKYMYVKDLSLNHRVYVIGIIYIKDADFLRRCCWLFLICNESNKNIQKMWTLSVYRWRVETLKVAKTG
jgi:hypothetical protein